MAYLTNMEPRLLEPHRVLKLTGSLYLHCDPTMSHYLKILLRRNH
jgi:site-specific DNA-methyltransferase (adenine-specific)